MRRKHIVIVGSSFAGFTAAMELKDKVKDQHDVTVVSKSDRFLFMPSLVWVPFGLRTKDEVTFAVGPPLEKCGVRFRQDDVTRFDLDGQTIVMRNGGSEHYDYLVIATGPKPNYGAVPGLGPRAYTQSIMALPHAEGARTAFERFLKSPGPVVVGAVQGASCFGAAYQFLFNMAQQLRKRGLSDRTPITYVTPEPFLAHFGVVGFGSATKIAESLFEKFEIRAITGAAVQEITPGEIRLADGQKVPFAYAMLVPPFIGVDAVRACEKITNASGFIRVNGFYQTDAYPQVFAAGAAVALDGQGNTPIPCGVSKTGYLSEEMARVVAHNVVTHIGGEEMVSVSPASIDAQYSSDASNAGADQPVEPREDAWLIPGPEAHWAELAIEKYFPGTRRR